MTDFVEMFRHWNAGRSQVQIREALNIDRKTIRKYMAPAIAEGLVPAPEELFDEQLWRGRIGRWFPELVDPSVRAVSWSQIAVHQEWIAEQLGVPVTVATIAQRLRDDRGVDVSESTVRRYIATVFAEQRLEDKVTVPRGAVEPAGSEAQIDYGRLGMWDDPSTGRRVAVWVFAMILSCSRALFIQPVLRMDQASWNASHVAAFEFFGGVPARLADPLGDHRRRHRRIGRQQRSNPRLHLVNRRRHRGSLILRRTIGGQRTGHRVSRDAQLAGDSPLRHPLR